MSNDLLITPASRKLELKDSSGNVDAVIETDGSGNLSITNTGGNITIGGASSNLFMPGNLVITGDINQNSVTDLDVTDKTITLGVGQAASSSGGTGLIISGSNANMLWDQTNSRFNFTDDINVDGFLITRDNVSSVDDLNSYIMSKTTGSFPNGTNPSDDNATGIISMQTHQGNYFSQLALDTHSNDLHIRSAHNSTSWGSWKRFLKAGEAISGTSITGTGLLTAVGGVINTNTGSNAFFITRQGNTNESLKIYTDDAGAIFESIQDESSDNYGNFIFAMDSGVTEPYFDIRKGTSSSGTKLYVDGGGNVGIGTSSPSQKLHVAGNIYAASGFVNSSGYQLNGTYVVDSSRNLVNIGTISSTGTATINGQVIVDGGTGVSSTGVLHVRQNGNGDGNGIAITSGHATSHRIWKNSSGILNIGSSSNTNAFQQDLSGNITIEGNVLATGSFTTNGTHTDYGVLRVAHPGGADRYSRTGTETGTIKITLPQSWTSTMLRFTVKIYDYSSNESFEVVCGGYTYSTGSAWYNTSAYIISDTQSDRNFTVRFGHDGSKCAVYIGETSASWSYPQITVTDFQAGFNNAQASKWEDGWDVSIESSFGTITATQTANEITSHHRLVRVGGTTVIDTSRNLTNIGSASFSGDVNFEGGLVQYDASSNSLKFGDGIYAQFGASDDLRIYHNGTDSYIQEAGTGNLNIKSNGTFINFLDGSNNLMAYMVPGGAVGLYHNTEERLTTQTYGVQIKSADVSGVAAPVLSVGQLNNAYQSGIQSSVHTTLKTTNSAGNFYFYRQSAIQASIIDGDICIGQTSVINSSRELENITKGTIAGGGASTSATLTLNSSTSTTFNHSINALNSNLTAGENNVIIVGKAGSTKNSGYIGYKWAGDGSNANVLTFGHWSSDNLMNLTGDGKLGIGTQTPVDKLDVNGNVNIGTNKLYNSANNNSAGLDFGGAFFKLHGYNGIIFYSSNAGIGSQTERMRITSSGNVGIGTSSPGSKLHVDGGSGTVIKIGDSTNNVAKGIEFLSSTSVDAFMKLTGQSGTLEISAGRNASWGGEIVLSTDTDERMRIDSSGNVGIGTTAPSTTLHVQNSSNNAEVIRITTTGDDPDKSMHFQSDHIYTTNGGLHLGINGNSTIYRGTGHFFQTGSSNTERVRINDTGVGIGTTNPQYKLVVSSGGASGLEFGPAYSGTANLIQSYNRSGSAYVHTVYDAAAHRFNISGNERLEIGDSEVVINDVSADVNFRVESNGNANMLFVDGGNDRVGIGTASPTYQLDIQGSTASARVKKTANDATVVVESTTAGAWTTYKSPNFYAGALYTINGVEQWAAGLLQGVDRWTIRKGRSGAEYFSILNGGNIGINNGAPSAKLHIVHNNTTDAMILESTEDSSSSAPVLTFKRNSSSVADADYLGQLKFKGENDADQEVVYAKLTAKIQDASDGTEDGMLEFMNKKAGSNEITARLRSDSFQLINGTKLQINNDSNDLSHIQDNNGMAIKFEGANLHIQFECDTTEVMRLESNGKLHCDNDVVAFSTTVSDERLKDKVVTIDNALDKVLKLRGVEYTWNNTAKKGKRDLGVIAQEVEEVLPEIVQDTKMALMNDEVYKTVDYEKMTGVLIEAMKEQQTIINRLEEKISDLEKKLIKD